MTAKELVVLEQVAFDLRQGKLFYDDAQQGVGDDCTEACTAGTSGFTVC